MSSFVITVELRTRPGRLQEFLPLIVANARQSLANDPGCRRFDVLVPRDSTDTIYLYEIYDDEAAFDAHRQMPHYKAFRAAAEPLLAETIIKHFDLAAV